jgi:hypothetical protein
MDPDDLDDDEEEAEMLVLRGVASSRYADPRDLVTLAEHPEYEIHETLAELGHLPVEAVDLLSRSPERHIRSYLVVNERLGPAADAFRQAVLVDDPSPFVRSLLLDRDLPPLLRARVLAGLAPHEVRHPQDWMPEELLVRLAADEDEDVREQAIWCLPGDSALLRELACSTDAALRRVVAWHDSLPVDLAARLSVDDDADVRRGVVRPDLALPVLTVLAQDPHTSVRTAVAVALLEHREREGALALLAGLARDPHEYVRSEVALEPAMHALLLDDDSDRVRAGLASSSDDPQLLRRLLDGPDPEDEVVPALVRNPRVPTSLLVELLDRLLRRWDAQSGLAPGEQPLEAYASWAWIAPSGWLRDLAENPALPEDLVRPLLLHRAPVVAEAALRRLPLEPGTVPAAALRQRARRGLLWQLLAEAGTDVDDPAVRAAALQALPTAAGTVDDLARLLR